MGGFDSNNLASWTNGAWKNNWLPKNIREFCFDTRLLKNGDCFIALNFTARDGHNFIDQAIEMGASCVLTERVTDHSIPQLVVKDSLMAMQAIGAAKRAQFHGQLAAITGSCGKTTTKDILRILLGSSETHATDGNWNNRIGVPMTLFGMNKYNKYAVIEAGINQPGEMVHLGQMIRADLVIVTHIGPAHLELLRSLEAIAEEKAHLIRLAKPDAPLVVTAEVYEHSAFRCYAKQSIVLANDAVNLPDEVRRVIRYAYTSNGIRLFNMNFEIASPSRGVRTNCALAIVAALNFGIKLEIIQQRLALWRPNSKRGFVWRDAKQIFYIDCYNANPSSMMDSLEAFKQTNVGEVARGYVIGAMNELGFQANQFHRSVGRALKLNSSDRVWFVGPAKLTREYCLGAKESGCSLDQIRCEDSVDKLKSDIAEFDGALFLKGSRVYQLETLLPDNFSSNLSN